MGNKIHIVGWWLFGLFVSLILFAEINAAFHKAIINGDEGFQFLKVVSVQDGHPLYQDVWSDQPPFHHLLLRVLFGIAGVSVLDARMMALGFSCLLSVCFWRLIARFQGDGVSVLAVALFLTVYPFLDLAAAVLIIIPAYALGLLSVLIFLHGQERSSRLWLLLSGVAMGFGLLTKFSALLLLPLIAALATPAHEWMLGHVPTLAASRSAWSGRKQARQIAWWAFGVGIAFFVVLLFEPRMFNSQLWLPHLSNRVRNAFSGSSNQMWATLAQDWGLIALAFYGIARLWEERRLGTAALPLVWLVISLAVHAWQRPFWPQYYLHLALPLSWLAATGIISGWQRIPYLFRETSVRRYWSLVDAVVLVVCLAAVLPKNLIQTGNAVGRLSHGRDDVEWEVVKAMEEFKPETKWAFSTSSMLVVQAGLRMPPELAVVSAKRFFSGDLSMKQLLEILDRYRPEQIVLQRRQYEEIHKHCAGTYDLRKQIGDYELFVRSDLILIRHPLGKARELPEINVAECERGGGLE